MEAKAKKQVNKKASCEEKPSSAMGLVKGLAIAYAITAIVFITYAILLTYTGITEKHIALVAIICTALSTIIAGFDSARGAKSRGFFWGLAAGAGYAVILFAIGILLGSGPLFDAGKITTLLISLAGGGVGGILGINTKK